MGNSYIKNMVISIHTSAREVTQSNSICSRIVPDFNPHFRKGSDFEKSAGEDYMFRISIHTSAREVTGWNTDWSADTGFQSTLPQGK